MGSFLQSFSSSSPIVVLSPQHPNKSFSMEGTSYFNGNSSFGQSSQDGHWESQPERPSTAGRKRSRDEAALNLDDDVYFPVTPAAAKESEEDYVYGEGMTLIKPNGFIIDASSQTGTWAEEEAAMANPPEKQPELAPTTIDRPILRSHKSQRLDLTATPAIAEEISLGDGSIIAPSPPKTTSNGREDPTVDDFTIYLGIGWSRISSDEHIQAAARGWAKFIENHYPISEPQIRLQSKGLASYLVEAREGWFLFGEELKEGRLVSTSLEKVFQNLRTSPPVFDDDEMLIAAAETPKVELETIQEFVMDDMHEVVMVEKEDNYGPAGQDMEVDMDMS